MFALRGYQRGMAGDANGEAPEAWSPRQDGGPTEGVGAWTVAKATTTEVISFALSHTNESWWSKRQNKRGPAKGKRKGQGREGK